MNKLLLPPPPEPGLRERRLQKIRNNTNLINFNMSKLVYQAQNQNVPVPFIVVISPITAVTKGFSPFLGTHLC